MYKESPVIETPPDDTRLWRYMNLSSFLALLKSKSLYFCHRYEFDDLWEGEPPANFVAGLEILTERVWKGESTSGSRAFRFVAEKTLEHATVNCWHEDDSESVAMWSLYTKGIDGVAIQTTVGKLKKVLQSSEHNIVIGRVQYDDHRSLAAPVEVKGFGALLLPLFQKRKSYRHEREVRAVIQQGIKIGKPEPVIPFCQRGIDVSVDVTELVERVVLSPNYPDWGRRGLQDIVTSAGLLVPVETSDLLLTPRSQASRPGAGISY